MDLIKNIGYDISTSINPKKTSNLQTFKITFPLQHPLSLSGNDSYDSFCSKGLFSKSELFFRIKNKFMKILNLN